MSDAQPKRGFIRNRRGAMVALWLTGILLFSALRAVLSNSNQQTAWLLDLDFVLPTWATATVNVMLYASLFWLGIVFYRNAQGKERILVGGWFIGILLSAARHLLSLPVRAVVVLQAVGVIVAFIAAIQILRESRV